MADAKLTKLQENKLSTFVDIETVLDRNEAIVKSVQQLADSTAEFKNLIKDINNKAVRRNSIKHGTSEAKSVKRTELENVTVELASALYVYGLKSSDEVVKAIANVPKSSLERMRDSDVINKAGAILTSLKENEEALPHYGINSDDIKRLSDCIESYIDTNTEKSGSHMESKVITSSLRELFQRCMDILDREIDNMVNSLQTREKNFFDSYYAVRTVKNLGLRHRKPSDPPQPEPLRLGQ